MTTFRVLNDGRLVLPDGTKLDLDWGWLSRDDAEDAVASADFVVHSNGFGSRDVSSDRDEIVGLLGLVDGGNGHVGARRYRGSGLVAVVLQEFH